MVGFTQLHAACPWERVCVKQIENTYPHVLHSSIAKADYAFIYKCTYYSFLFTGGENHLKRNESGFLYAPVVKISHFLNIF